MIETIDKHIAICEELTSLYQKKNRDYGDSFRKSYLEWGLPMVAIRLADKYNRFASLIRNNDQQVKDESIRDTLIDIANYAIMTIMELDSEEKS